MFIEALVVTGLVLSFVLFYRPKPPTPPSASAALQDVDVGQPAAHSQGREPLLHSDLSPKRDNRSPSSTRSWLVDNSADAYAKPGAPMRFSHSLAHLCSNVPWLLVVGMNGLMVAVFSALPTFGDRFMQEFGYDNSVRADRDVGVR